MPVSTGAVQTADDYAADNDGNGGSGATIGLFETLASIQFTVGEEGNVIAQVGKKKKQDNSTHWDPTEVTFGPGPGGYEGEIHGLRFRSAESGAPVTVIINGYFADDPIPFETPPGGIGLLGSATGFASYSAGGSIFDNVTTHFNPITWDALPGQEDMFDLTNPENPVARRTGIYTIDFLVVQAGVASVDGVLSIFMDLNNSKGGSGSTGNSSPMATGGHPNLSATASASLTWPLQAGDSFDQAISQSSGAARNFSAAWYATRR